MIATTRTAPPTRGDLPPDVTLDAIRRFLSGGTPPRPSRATREAAQAKDESAFPLILDALAALGTTPAVAEIGAALASLDSPRERPGLVAILRGMERVGLVETWPDPARTGEVRVMLLAVALRRLGLALAPRGDRWQPAL